MNKKFDNEHPSKSSDDCDKYSKSVSYETLVDGTATIGREYKQTRRLFLSSANKPLTAVGTLTSLPCNSAKVVEKWLQMSRDLRSDNESEKNGKVEGCAGYRFCKTMRFLCKNLVDDLSQISPVFRLVKVLSLVVVLSISMVSKSSAETWNCGEKDKQGNYGNNVQCTLENGVFTVTGNGNMSDYSITTDNWLTTAPWNDYRKQITEIKISEGVSSIGAWALYGINSVSKITIPSGVTSIYKGALAGNKLKSIEIPNTVVRIESYAFETDLLETINIPDSVQYLAKESFDNNPRLKEIYISDNINTSNWDVSAFDDIRSTPNIICQGERSTCLIKMQKFIDAGSITEEQIIQAVEGECNSVQYFDGRKCKKVLKDGSKPCATGFKRNEAYCNRIRYTPAEAAQVLRDDNTNSVTITFKK